jgi:hypothetical protein
VPAEQIAENLAYINWTVLASLAVGSITAAVLARLLTSATRGYVAFIALSAVLLAVLAALSDDALPAATLAGVDRSGGATFDVVRRVGLWALAALAALDAIAVIRGRSGRTIGVAAVVAGGASLAAGAIAWGDGPVGVALLLVQLVSLAAATGGVWAAMVLGHWYLVTPKLPEAPLVLFSRALVGVVAIQIVLFAVWTASGAGPSGSPGFAALAGSWAMFVWLRLIVGLVMPLVITWAAVQTARTRSMESATGLLYIDVGLIAAGTILSAGLYFGAGLLV